MRAATVLLLLVAGFAAGQHTASRQAFTVRIVAPGLEAQCSTDTDCMRLCPPDDRDCDGGPESKPIITAERR